MGGDGIGEHCRRITLSINLTHLGLQMNGTFMHCWFRTTPCTEDKSKESPPMLQRTGSMVGLCRTRTHFKEGLCAIATTHSKVFRRRNADPKTYTTDKAGISVTKAERLAAFRTPAWSKLPRMIRRQKSQDFNRCFTGQIQRGDPIQSL